MSRGILDVHVSEQKEIIRYVEYCRFIQLYEVYLVIEDTQILLLVWKPFFLNLLQNRVKIRFNSVRVYGPIRTFSAYIV